MSVTAAFRKQVVDDIEANALTSKEAGAKYCIKHGTIRQWVKRARATAPLPPEIAPPVRKKASKKAPKKAPTTKKAPKAIGPPIVRPVARKAWDTFHKQRAPMDGLPEETRDQVVSIVRRTYDLIEKALDGEHQRLDDKSELGPNVTPRLDQKVASAVRSWQGTIALMIDTHPGVLTLVKSGATDSASQTAERAKRVAEALLGDLPPEAP